VEAKIGGYVLLAVLLIVLLPVWRWLFGYIFKTTDILKELRQLNKKDLQ